MPWTTSQVRRCNSPCLSLLPKARRHILTKEYRLESFLCSGYVHGNWFVQSISLQISIRQILLFLQFFVNLHFQISFYNHLPAWVHYFGWLRSFTMRLITIFCCSNILQTEYPTKLICNSSFSRAVIFPISFFSISWFLTKKVMKLPFATYAN